MKTYTLELTDAQAKALSVIALDPQDFLQNFANVQADNAMEQIVNDAVARSLDSGGVISGTREDIVMSALVETAAARQDRMNALAAASNAT